MNYVLILQDVGRVVCEARVGALVVARSFTKE